MSPGISTRLLATQSDERLLAFVRDGHERAFEVLVHRYRRPLLSYCRRLPLPAARAEDVVQLSLLKAWVAVREGAEVRDLKAWLYRVVHNTAVNAARTAAREGGPLAERWESHSPGLHSRSHSPESRGMAPQPDIDLGLRTREALAEVAALPPLQREVIVRTAVAGHSHERVASDLGLSGGAVRGLLYRARATLRRAATALTPPQLLAWVVGRANQSAPATPAPERLAELVGGGGAMGLGGLLLKGGAVALTAGVLGGAALVHLSASTHHRARHLAVAAQAGRRPEVAGSPSGIGARMALAGSSASASSASSTAAQRSRRSTGRGRPGAGRSHAAGASLRLAGGSPSGGFPPRSFVHDGGGHGGSGGGGGGHGTPPRAEGPVRGATPPPSGAGQGTGSGGGSGQSGAPSTPPSGGSSSPPAEPVGSAASSGSSGGGSTPPAGSSGEGSGAPSGSQSSGSSGSSGSESSSGTGSPGGSEPAGGKEPPSGSSGEHPGLVGTVVHEVGSILEHVLH